MMCCCDTSTFSIGPRFVFVALQKMSQVIKFGDFAIDISRVHLPSEGIKLNVDATPAAIQSRVLDNSQNTAQQEKSGVSGSGLGILWPNHMRTTRHNDI